MAEGRRGLGRGLSALLDEVDAGAPEMVRTAGAQELPIELIHRNPEQPRRQFDEAELEELAASIRERGVLQAILVRPAPGAAGEYQIVAGERRWRASQLAGLKTIPAMVRAFDDLQVLEVAIIENVQRTDLSPIEEAEGYRTLMERFGRTQDALSQVVGKSRSHVANTLRLLKLPQSVQDHVREGRLSAGHARALATSDEPEAKAREVISKGLSVRDTETLAKSASPVRPARAGQNKDPDTLDLEANLASVLGLQVSIRDHGGAGEVRISYGTLEQLDDLCRRLTRGA